jgi:hypothetical protein
MSLAGAFSISASPEASKEATVRSAEVPGLRPRSLRARSKARSAGKAAASLSGSDARSASASRRTVSAVPSPNFRAMWLSGKRVRKSR